MTKTSPNRFNSRFNRQQWLEAAIGKEGVRRIATGMPLDKPVQIEIHPYSAQQESPCSNDCVWCTRKYDRQKLVSKQERGIDPDRLIEFIESFDGPGIQEFALAGNSTEPLLYPRIEEVIASIKAVGSAVRLYTNFQHGERILDVVPKMGETDIIRISLDAGSADSYQKTHCPVNPHAFDTIMQNLGALLKKRKKSKGKFAVIVTYLVSRLNCGDTEIEGLMRWCAQEGVDAVTFIRPLAPSHSNQEFSALSQAEAKNVASLVASLEKDLAGCCTEFTFSMAHDVERSKPFKSCHYWKMAAVLGSRGMFFPCTSTAVAEYVDRLGRAHIHSKDFDFWAFWKDEKKWTSLDLGCCPECTRAEYAFNRLKEFK